MNGRVFLDTNVLIYLYDTDAPEKQAVSRAIVQRASKRLDLTAVISTQVLQEFYATVTRKFLGKMHENAMLIAMYDLRALPTVQVNVPMIFEAIELSRRFRLSFWDSLIVESATIAGCSRLLTEDLQHQMRIGDLVVENPFFEI